MIGVERHEWENAIRKLRERNRIQKRKVKNDKGKRNWTRKKRRRWRKRNGKVMEEQEFEKL